MIVCPNCSHANPDGAINCEACYTALPISQSCPNCGASIQPDATFCGQCGIGLKPASPESEPVSIPGGVELPPTVLSGSALPETVVLPTTPAATIPDPPSPEPAPLPDVAAPTPVPPPAATQLQQAAYQLFHIQSESTIEIPPQLNVLHIGKPNDRVPPDIDVSGFPYSEVVSRVHADLRVEGDNYYIEDTASANGTYINHNVLPKGNRHLLRVGDRISLGKGDLVTFLFQSSRVT
jgi:hypothetical protein